MTRSGAHVNPRRKLTATAEHWSRWDAAARAAGISWAQWATEALDHQVARQESKARRSGARAHEGMARRIVRLLGALHDSVPNGLTIPELMDATGQSRATVYRNLATLRESGLAVEANTDDEAPLGVEGEHRVRYAVAQTTKAPPPRGRGAKR